MESGEVALGRCVKAGGMPRQALSLLIRCLDGVPFLVEVGVVDDWTAAPAAFVVLLGGLMPLSRDDCVDAAFAQVERLLQGESGLVPQPCRGERERGHGNGPADPYLLECEGRSAGAQPAL